MENKMFVTPQEVLAEQSYQILLKKKSEKELYMEKQKKILKEIFEE